jgi:hypothetical protein
VCVQMSGGGVVVVLVVVSRFVVGGVGGVCVLWGSCRLVGFRGLASGLLNVVP